MNPSRGSAGSAAAPVCAGDASAFEEATYRTVTRHVMPLLFVCYILSYIDRVNVGFAKLQMQQDLHMSDTTYGIAAGIYCIGYFIFEVPANLLLQRIGARRWLSSIMMVWGLVSASTMFVRTAGAFYVLRFVLGVVEAGFFPGVILYLTFWYTRRHRAKIIAMFMTAIPLSGVVSGAVSGWILSTMSHAGGLRGWQLLFLCEGLPPVVAGLVTLLLLKSGPEEAGWLSREQKDLIAKNLRAEDELKESGGRRAHRFQDAFRSPAVWLLSLVFFGFAMANYGISYWMPQMISDTVTHDPLTIGLLSMIPWGVGALSMVLVGRHSDATGERRWHIAIAATLGGVTFAVSAIPGLSGGLSLTALTLATAGVLAATSTFWSLPSDFLSGAAAAAGIAVINSVGNLSGYLSPFMAGWIRDTTHSMEFALLMFSGSCIVGALVVAMLKLRGKHPPEGSEA
jgi:D-galactonate transporter